MKYNPKIHNRRTIRLKGYDYSQAGLYYITICVQNRECLFGEIVLTNDDQPRMQLNDAGQMVRNEWLDIPNRFPHIQLHEFIIMPNHFHAIMEIVGASLVGAHDETDTHDMDAQNTVGIPNNPDGENENDPAKIGGSRGIGRPQGCAPTGDQNGNNVQNTADARNKTVGDVVGAFKSITTNEYIGGVKNHNWPRFNGKLWQRNYWEHIIRDEKSYQRISDYIINNPLNWADDKLYKA